MTDKTRSAKSHERRHEIFFGLLSCDFVDRFFLICTLILLAWGSVLGQVEHSLWFDKPADHFTASTPLGNGRLGAMIFGGVDDERIVLNETGMWSGSRQDADRPEAALVLPEIRRLLLDGKNVEAEKLINANFTCAGPGSARGRGARAQYGAYQLLGNLHLKFIHENGEATARDYRRELDLSEAVARISYEKAGVQYHREAFVSAPDQAMVIRLAANKRASTSLDIQLDRPERSSTVVVGTNELLMSGRLENGTGGEGVSYATRIRIINRGGTVTSENSSLCVRGADEVLLFVTAATDIHTFAGRKVDDAAKTAATDLDRASGKTFAKLRRNHVADYQNYFNRVSLRIGSEKSSGPGLPIPQRLQAMSDGKSDSGLMQLYFDFGRYLLISSSRPGGLPANLQGIWAEEIQTPWNADWHLNVNVQMNYWPAEVCNLSELHQPLFALIESLQEPGTRTAKKYYGAHGWVAHVITNPWGFTAPGEAASWGATTTGAAWLCQHLWDHYLFTGDRKFLRWAYPIIKGSAQFYRDMLIKEPRRGWLVTAPSNSPENSFVLPDGTRAHISMGATMDMQLLRYLFGAGIEAAKILGTDAFFARELSVTRNQLAPTSIGSDGRIKEWLEEYKEADPQHRHVSHLWGLYPGFEISRHGTPDLAIAARKTLDVRGDGGTGWSIAHKLALRARLGDGDHAYDLLRAQLKPATITDRITTTGGGTYPNFFGAHPPFQIDGNFGATAGIAEMLLQSTAGEITLLPALPKAWSEGAVRGLRARGGYTVGLSWQNGKVVEASLRSATVSTAKIRVGDNVRSFTFAPGQTIRLDANLRKVFRASRSK
jgi:alpha-L-fucosidase 2